LFPFAQGRCAAGSTWFKELPAEQNEPLCGPEHQELEDQVKPMDRITRFGILVIALLLAVIALELHFNRPATVFAESGRFDYVQIVAASFVYNGETGVLVLDRRNANVWFIPRARNQDMKTAFYKDPVFVVRVPLEKLDEQAR
jgi:hypothetical protein